MLLLSFEKKKKKISQYHLDAVIKERCCGCWCLSKKRCYFQKVSVRDINKWCIPSHLQGGFLKLKIRILYVHRKGCFPRFYSTAGCVWLSDKSNDMRGGLEMKWVKKFNHREFSSLRKNIKIHEWCWIK